MFGSLADECLDYAQRNRSRWVEEGEQVVQEMLLEQMEDTTFLGMLDTLMAECDELLG